MDKQLIGGTETRRRYNKNEPVLNVAILGCGAIAEKRHAPVISRFKGAALYGLYGPHENRIRELACHYEAVKIFTELEPLLVDPQVKAVSICAPEKFHCELAVKSLEAGKHVLLEKPMAMTVAEAEHIIAARNHAGTLLMIAFSQRCYPQHILARRLLREGAIGQPLSFRTILSNSGVEYAVIQQNTSDFYDRNLANIGGVMLNVGCHRIDLIRFLFDSDFLRVLAYTQAMDKHFSSGKLIDREDTALVTAELENGVNGTLWISWCNYGQARTETEIFGTTGSIQIEAEMVQLWRGGESLQYPISVAEADPRGFKIVENFLDTVINDAPPAVTAEDGLACMRVLEAVEKSNHKGGWIDI